MGTVDFNPRSPRGGATKQGLHVLPYLPRISIHAPREGERRLCPCGLARRRGYFNPRSPRGGATGLAVKQHISTSFQSTLPARGSDEEAEAKAAKATKFQSTLPARGSDQMRVGCRGSLYHFNPRSPRGGATGWRCTYNEYPNISIHAPREGERLYALPSFGDCLRISIHAPREGERRG